MLLLIDGYNVVSPIAPPNRNPDPRWLNRERNQLLKRLGEHLDVKIRGQTCVVFDAAQPPPDRPSRYLVDGIDVRFAVGYDEADDLIEELIAANSSPKNLAVVSSDHRIQAAAKRRGSTFFDSEPWLDDLLDGRVRLSDRVTSRERNEGDRTETHKPDSVSGDDTSHWMREFGFED